MPLPLCSYSPFVGEGPPAPSTTSPVLTRRSTIILTYPYVTPTLTLELRNPDFDTIEQFEYRRIHRRSRGATLQVFRDPIWPEAERTIISFSALKQEEITNLFVFLQASLGQEIGYLDFESRQWRGIILTPAAQVAEPSRRGFSVTLEIEGSLA